MKITYNMKWKHARATESLFVYPSTNSIRNNFSSYNVMRERESSEFSCSLSAHTHSQTILETRLYSCRCFGCCIWFKRHNGVSSGARAEIVHKIEVTVHKAHEKLKLKRGKRQQKKWPAKKIRAKQRKVDSMQCARLHKHMVAKREKKTNNKRRTQQQQQIIIKWRTHIAHAEIDRDKNCRCVEWACSETKWESWNVVSAWPVAQEWK